MRNRQSQTIAPSRIFVGVWSTDCTRMWRHPPPTQRIIVIIRRLIIIIDAYRHRRYVRWRRGIVDPPTIDIWHRNGRPKSCNYNNNCRSSKKPRVPPMHHGYRVHNGTRFLPLQMKHCGVDPRRHRPFEVSSNSNNRRQHRHPYHRF